MSGYAANLIRSGARGLTTRRKSYAAATLSTVLRSPRDRQAPAEAPATGPGELAHTVLADVSHQHLGTSSAAPMRKVEAVRMAAQPLQDAPALPPVQISLPAVQLEPSFNVPPVPQSGTTHPKPALTHLPYATPAATPPTSPKSMIAEKKPSVPGRATDVRGTTPAVAPTPSEEPEIDTSPVQVMLMTPEPARQGFYHGRHIRIEHSSPAPNPTVALLQQRPGPAQPGRPAQSNMKEGASPIARTGKPAAATAPSQDIPRIAASQKNSAAATPAGNR